MDTFILSLLAMLILGLVAGGLLGWASEHLHVEEDSLANQINQLLPQTQCGQCSYPGCKPYAEQIAAGNEPINRCVPGGDETIHALADLLGVKPLPLDESCGIHQLPRVAFIREEECIGCTKCIQACPVDAILGASKQMHTVIRSECTGCDLCVAPCPVDCIEMRPAHNIPFQDWNHYFKRYEPDNDESNTLIIASDKSPRVVS